MTALPDLDRYTDRAAVRALLQARLPGFADGSLHLEDVTVSQVRRNTSRERNPSPLALCYELKVKDAVQGRCGSQLLYAQVYRDGHAATALAQQDRSRLVPPAFGEALTHLPDLGLLLWALPNDPGLPQLVTLLDPARLASALPGCAGQAARAPSAAAPGVELLRYTPQRRATLRVTLSEDAASAAPGTPRQLYAKTFFNTRAELIHQRFSYFWDLAQADPQAPLVAQPLGHDPATRTLWQAPAQGEPLSSLLSSPQAAARLGQVAHALALLHASPLLPATGTKARNVQHWLAEARRRQQKISRVNAALAARATAVADAIERHAAHPATRPLSLIHGDFHPDQIWVHEGRVVLFDFDEFTWGDPMEDLAEFVLKLELLGAAPALSAAFIDHYAAAAPQRFDLRALNWHLTIQHLLQASRAFVYQQSGWAALLQRRLEASAAKAEALERTPAP